ncbi:MAG: hypothetical protein M3Z04_00245 [Chloroflexota bacterium]|nr:hypothetical protein [Chloroflexota bacterium]
MLKLRSLAVSLLLALPLLAGCDSGTPPTTIPTALPTSTVAPTATALPPTVSNTATSLPLNSAATAATTALTGAATAVTAVLSSTLSADDQAYLQQVSTIATGVVNAPEMSAAVTELATAAGNGVLGGNVDTAALTTKLSKAGTILDNAATQAGALHPSANMQSIQNELVKAISDWQGSLKTAQTAVSSQNWTDAAAAIGQLGSAGSEMSTLLTDLAARAGK